MVLAIAYSESTMGQFKKHPDPQYKGIGGISVKLWGKELKEAGIKIDSLKAIEYVLEKIGLKRYKGADKRLDTYVRTISLYNVCKVYCKKRNDSINVFRGGSKVNLKHLFAVN